MSEWMTLERLENNDFDTPKYATNGSSGLDFKACLSRKYRKLTKDGEFVEHTAENNELTIKQGEVILVPLGWKIEFAQTHSFHIYVRSSMGIKGLRLANQVGIIDSDYRNELFAPLTTTKDSLTIRHGDRIIQGILVPIAKPLIKVGEVTRTERAGGFGSTGA